MSVHRTSSCSGKHRYASGAEASRVIAARQHEAQQPHHPHKEAKRSRAALNCYRCRHCKGFHIGGGER